MDHAIIGTPTETVLYGALEQSKNSWLLALQLPDRAQPSLYPIRGGNTEGLMAKLMAARDRWANISGKAPSIMLCYEAGYTRFLKARGIECLLVDAASTQVNRRARRAKKALSSIADEHAAFHGQRQRVIRFVIAQKHCDFIDKICLSIGRNLRQLFAGCFMSSPIPFSCRTAGFGPRPR